MPTGRLPTGRLIAHSLINIPIVGAMVPLALYLPSIYAQHFGISLYVLGAIFLSERIWGTFTDPLVGWLCDRTVSRHGRRKVWIAGGSLLFACGYGYLFFPEGQVSPIGMTIALFVLFFAWSMIVVPYYAWSGELTRDYHERTRITTFQTVTSSLAQVFILILPALADSLRPGDQLLKLNLLGAAVLVPMIPGTVLGLLAFPDTAPAQRRSKRRSTWREVLGAVSAERTILKIMLADFAITFAQSIRGGLLVFYVTYVAGMPQLASSLFLFQFVFGIAAAPIWQHIARRIGKHKAVIAGELAQVVINLALILVGAGDMALLLILTMLQGLTQGSGNLLLRAMLADVADDYRQRTGQDRSALLFSVFSTSGKAGSAIPLGLALPLIAWFGFDPKAASHPPTGLLALTLVFTIGPALAHLAATLFIRRYPIDEAQQIATRKLLEKEA
jgi:GPH family glycoside/pentoside/hexuronide:cation symporter